MKKILITGANGMLGYAVSEFFKKRGHYVEELTRKEFDIASQPFEKLEKYLEDKDFVINCAGVIKPRIATMSVEDVLKVNSIFPKNLAKLCKSKGIECFHITTDCVFSGKKGNYDERDYFDAEDLYGLSKNAGEPTDCMTLRTSIIGEEKREGRSLLEWARSQAGKEVNGFTNHNWNGVTTLYLAEIIEKIYNEGLYTPGVFHIHSLNMVDKFELLRIFNKVYELDLKINSVEAEVACDRSMNSIFSLSSKTATKEIETQVREMKEFFEDKK